MRLCIPFQKQACLSHQALAAQTTFGKFREMSRMSLMFKGSRGAPQVNDNTWICFRANFTIVERITMNLSMPKLLRRCKRNSDLWLRIIERTKHISESSANTVCCGRHLHREFIANSGDTVDLGQVYKNIGRQRKVLTSSCSKKKPPFSVLLGNQSQNTYLL